MYWYEHVVLALLILSTRFIVYLCHDTETCTTTCPADRRRRRALAESETSDSSTGEIQSNGIPQAQVLSAEIIVPDDALQFALESKPVRNAIQNLDTRMKTLRKAIQSMNGPISKLKKLANQDK